MNRLGLLCKQAGDPQSLHHPEEETTLELAGKRANTDSATGRPLRLGGPKPTHSPLSPKAWRYLEDHQDHRGREEVSILTRPKGRALLEADAHYRLALGVVSILTRPKGRALLEADAHYRLALGVVSILTRPKGRALLEADAHYRLALGVVSILTRPKGRALLEADAHHRLALGVVSILTRPKGRALRGHSGGGAPPPPCFNPHPAQRPGATATLKALAEQAQKFQSSPGPKAGRYALRTGAGQRDTHGPGPYTSRQRPNRSASADTSTAEASSGHSKEHASPSVIP